MSEYAILFVAAFFAGVLNTVAGGGTFLTLPALFFMGVPIVTANATSSVAVFPGYLGGVLGFRREIATVRVGRLLRICSLASLGSIIGAGLLLVSSNDAFAVLVPFLLAAATLIFAFGPKIQEHMSRRRSSPSEGWIGTLAVAVYGGYFNGGLGIVLLALFSYWGMRDLNAMNGLKSMVSFVVSMISVSVFALVGLVAWNQALVMMVAATMGGYCGAPLARVLPAHVLRRLIVAVGATMSCLFLLRLL